jgi:hypothetical protein
LRLSPILARGGKVGKWHFPTIGADIAPNATLSHPYHPNPFVHHLL